MGTDFRLRGGFTVLVTVALLAALPLIAAAPASAAAPVVNVTLEPSQITLGDSAQLTITSSSNRAEPPKLPDVPGLDLRIVGQSQRIQMVNGVILSSSSTLVRVTPQTAGVFTIPALAPNTEPLVLRVSPAGAPAAPGNAPGSGAAGLGAGANGMRMTADGAAFVRLILPKRDIYVGESVPVDIEVGLRDGFARPNALPTLEGGDFTLNNLSHQPEQAPRAVDGKPYMVLTWHSVVAAVKPGRFSLTVALPLTVRIRTRPQRDSMIDDLLGDPFMQNFFGATITKEITATSPPSEMTVLELPAEGRPPDFNGAVGSFKIAGELSAAAAAAGDPLTLRMHVTGSGNFDRVDSNMLQHLDHWKTYPPKSTFKAADALGLQGEKTFEQPLIASTPGTHTLPGLAFSYFDPAAHRYQTVRTTPLEVAISASPADGSPNASQPGTAPGAASSMASSSASPAGAGAPVTPGLRPDHLTTGDGAGTLTPLYLQPDFLAIPTVLTLAIAGGWWGLRRHAGGAGASRRGRRRGFTRERILADLESAARARDAAVFFPLARSALEDRRVAPDDDVRRFLAAADEAAYAGHEPSPEEFAAWMQWLRGRLAVGRDAPSRAALARGTAA